MILGLSKIRTDVGFQVVYNLFLHNHTNDTIANSLTTEFSDNAHMYASILLQL